MIQDNSVSGNEGELSGGGIYSAGSNLIISNCLIAGNACGGGSPWNSEPFNGGGVYCTGSSVSIVNSTIVGNSADGMGGGVYCYFSDVSISNSILWGNAATEGLELATDYYGWWSQSSRSYDGWPVTYVSYSDIRGGQAGVYVGHNCVLEWGDGNIDVDPLFADASGGDYHLAFESPCVDIGDNLFVGDGDMDLDGNGRIFDGDGDGIWTVDIGAYEVWPSDTLYLAVSPHEFVFHGFADEVNPPEQILEVRNFGTGSFGWEISFDCEWLEAWPMSGELWAGELDEIRLGVDVSGLAVGSYECVLTISAGQVEK